METTNDMKKLDHKTLTKSFHRWFWGALTCFSQEHMQTFGYMASMLPILRKLYPNMMTRSKPFTHTPRSSTPTQCSGR